MSPRSSTAGAASRPDALDARDRLGHSLKIGHGAVNARAARLAAVDPFCLALFATRPVPDPPGESRAFALARAWRAECAAPARPASRRRSTTRRPRRLSRLFLTSLPVQEALCWLARHVRRWPSPAVCRRGRGSITARWWNAFVT